MLVNNSFDIVFDNCESIYCHFEEKKKKNVDNRVSMDKISIEILSRVAHAF